jgi:hypothetical protein
MMTGVTMGTGTSTAAVLGLGDGASATAAGSLGVRGSLGLTMARKMAPTMAAMTSATPAQRAGETAGSCFFPELRLELARRVVPPLLAEAMRRLVE